MRPIDAMGDEITCTSHSPDRMGSGGGGGWNAGNIIRNIGLNAMFLGIYFLLDSGGNGGGGWFGGGDGGGGGGVVVAAAVAVAAAGPNGPQGPSDGRPQITTRDLDSVCCSCFAA